MGASLIIGIEAALEDGRLAGKLELEDARAAGYWIEVEHARLLGSAN